MDSHSICPRCLWGGSSKDSGQLWPLDRKSTRLNSSHILISYAVFCLKKKNKLGYVRRWKKEFTLRRILNNLTICTSFRDSTTAQARIHVRYSIVSVQDTAFTTIIMA